MAEKSVKKTFTVAVVMQSPDLGGAETYMLSLISLLLKQNTRVFVASNKEKFFKKAQELPITTLEIPYIMDITGNFRGLVKTILLFPWEFAFYSKLLKRFKNESVDVILMSNFTEKLFVSFLSQFYQIPVVWIEYGRLETVFKRNFYFPKLIYCLLRNIPYRIIVPAKNTIESLLIDAGVSKKKLSLVPLGITVKETDAQRLNAVLPILKNKLVIGNVSRLTREKGQDYLIKAMPNIIRKIPNAYLLLIGDGPDKIYYNDLIKKLNLVKYVCVVGFAENLFEYYENMDIFVFPTVWKLEGFGLVVTEAMSHKLPVIASRLGPVPEIVDDGKTGLLVQPKNEKALAQAIVKLAKDPKKRKLFGENGYKKYAEKYTIEKSSSQILTILYEAANI